MLLVPTLPIGGRPTWSYVQGAHTQTIDSSDLFITKSFANPVGIGNIVLVGVLFGNSIGTPIITGLTLTDDKNNVYNLVSIGLSPALTGVPYGYATFISAAPITNSPTTLTCTSSLSFDTMWMVQDEFKYNGNSKLISVDGRQGFYGATPSTTIPGFVAQKPYSLNWAVCFCQGNVGVPGSGWTAGQGNGTQLCTQWRDGDSAAGSTVSIPFASVPASGNYFYVGGVSVNPTAQNSWTLRQAQVSYYPGTIFLFTGFTAPTLPGSIVLGSVSAPTNPISNIQSFTYDVSGTPVMVSPSANETMFWSGDVLASPVQGIEIVWNNPVPGEIRASFYEFVPPTGTMHVELDSSANTNSGTSTNLIAGPVSTTGYPDLVYSYVRQTGTGTQVAPICGLGGLGGPFIDGFYITDTTGDVQADWTTTGSLTSIGIMALRAYPY